MANPSQQLDANRHRQTICSNCKTVFEVPPALLSSSETRVRCGECLSIFDALEGLCAQTDTEKDSGAKRQSKPLSPGALPASKPPNRLSNAEPSSSYSNETGSLDVTYSDFDLFSEEADLPEIAYFDQTRDSPDFDFDSVEMGNDETFSDTLFASDVTIDAPIPARPPVSRQPLTKAPKAPKAPKIEEANTFGKLDHTGENGEREPLLFQYPSDDATSSDQSAAAPQSTRSAAAKADARRGSQAARSFDRPATELHSENTAAVGESALHDVLSSHEVSTESTFTLPAETPRSPWVSRALMGVGVMMLLAALWLYRSHETLYTSPTFRPMLVSVCSIFGCEVPARADMDKLTVLRRNVYSHPKIEKALVVDISFRNDAEFEQPYPAIVMLLSNQVGRAVAKRDFFPVEYLSDWQEGDTIASGKQLDVTLEVSDPGSSAQSFEFKLRAM